ncbi:uncharacterized protein JN550_005584 [Neoarthrinium moseri]|uniref:uncharacterized protein n=1 Tax=Neoarthrinium moseri TaxID=1658444 RepID=UPI001FDD0E93|nr:uncharacterized protein JN550_005584 [Neoarthrinium moseri]KAI1869994.1 hypothetical protein JN550_005584 [Neoarthrinium moseri]
MPSAIVTGANSGIGHKFAKILIREGYDVHAVDVNHGDKLRSLSCKTSQLDVSSPDSIAAFAESFGAEPLDLLLNIAGTMAATHDADSLEHVDHATLECVFGVNTFGPLLLPQALLPSTHALEDAVEPDEAAEKLWRVLLEKELDDSGRFWHRAGQELPW